MAERSISQHLPEWGLPVLVDNIPEELRIGAWCVWRAFRRDESSGKVDKIPYGPAGRISTAKPEQWLTFEQAVDLYRSGGYNGIGKLCQPGLGMIYVDVDRDTNVDAWLARFPTYCELSPSGKGLRLVGWGATARDIAKPVEIYAGHRARFVTITGHRVGFYGMSDISLAALEVAEEEPRLQLLPEHELMPEQRQGTGGLCPDVLPWNPAWPVQTFRNPVGGRSEELMGMANQLCRKGYADPEVLSILAGSPEVWNMALEHRRGIEDKARAYLWDHCLKARALIGREAAAAAEAVGGLGSDPAGQASDPASDGGAILDDHGEMVSVRYSDVKMTDVEWLWRGVLVAFKMNLIAGDPGIGKSLLWCMIVAYVTTGRPWPNGAEACVPMEVAVLAHEDAIDDTLGPRIVAAGGDPSKVHGLQFVKRATPAGPREAPFNLEDNLIPLERFLAANPKVKLLVIDPINSFLGKRVDAYKDNEVRDILTPLVTLIEKYGVTLLCISHLNKNKGTSANYRLQGSIAFTAVSRSVFLVTPNELNPSERLVLPVKSNAGKDKAGFGYTIAEVPVEGLKEPVARMEVSTQAVQQTADEVVGGGGREHLALDAAVHFLEVELANGPVQSSVLKDRARDAAHSWATVRRAQKLLHIVTSPNEDDGKWYWSLPKPNSEYFDEIDPDGEILPPGGLGVVH